MNCLVAQKQIFAERDGALDTTQRAALSVHLAACADCRQTRSVLATTFESWRAATDSIAVPDAEREWLDVRRRIRGGVTAGTSTTVAPLRRFAGWLAFAPVAAAAALAVVLWTHESAPVATPHVTPAPKPMVARNDAVEVSAGDGSVVFVDDKSGWVVVWDGDARRG